MKDKLIGLFLILMGLIWAGMGASELKENMAAKAPTPLTWQAFSDEKPTAGWFKVSGAQLEVGDALWVEGRFDGEMGNIYIPARAADNEGDEEKPIEMLVKVSDPAIMQTVREMKELDTGTDEAALKYALSHMDQLIIKRPLTGTIADGFDAVDSDEKDVLQSADVQFADDFVILQEGEKPAIAIRIFMVLLGIGVFGVGLFYLIWKKPAPPAPTTASGFPSLTK